MGGFRRCVACRQRWAQESSLCRRCARDPEHAGLLEQIDRRAKLIEIERELAIASLTRRLPRDAPNRTIVVRGVRFEVMWDGT
jgi:hypothetical protein